MPLLYAFLDDITRSVFAHEFHLRDGGSDFAASHVTHGRKRPGQAYVSLAFGFFDHGQQMMKASPLAGASVMVVTVKRPRPVFSEYAVISACCSSSAPEVHSTMRPT